MNLTAIPLRSIAAAYPPHSAAVSPWFHRMLYVISFRDTLAACTSSLAKRYANFGNSTQTAKVSLPAGSKSCSGMILQALRPCVPPSMTADKVGDFIVFNVGGNKYRLITAIHFNRRKFYIRNVLTHQEYNRGAWKS
jgi:hypothetical protein